ncbi:hypothetical protein [Sphingomonas guangdongensis]|uniref:hypothetical protein n=1 Tax=Sphingomonas guangdongensis TaxID=1141890 RepID=UPI000BE2BA23|nr:hypothetical protein [Sphingomonas guangdongensis]
MSALFIEADEPLLVFPSIGIAERALEAVDVRDGVYGRAFGPEGETFSITADDKIVVIEPTLEPHDPESLKELLRRSLAQVGETMPGDADLPTLVAAAEAFWNERDPYGERFGSAIPWWGCAVVGATLVILAIYMME